MATEDTAGIEGIQDPEKLRRFALGVALVLIIFVVAGGTLKEEVQGPVIGVVKFQRPGILLFLLALCSVYATARYTYYTILAPVTRVRVRHYLMSDWSMMCAKMTEDIYREQLKHPSTRLLNEHVRLERRSLPGLTPWHFIVFTDHVQRPDADLIKHICANRIDTYFPGITFHEITLHADQDHYVLGKVGPLLKQTKRRILLEECDTYLPL